MALADALSILVERALADVGASANLERLDDVRVRLLGKKGQLTEQLKGLGALPAAERPAAGQKINEAKAAIQTAIESRREALEASALDAELAKIEGVTPQRLDAQCTRNGQYAQIFHVDSGKFGGISMQRFAEAMIAEGIPNQASYPPLHERDVFRNGSYRERLSGTQKTEPHEFLRGEFPNTKRAAWETYWVPQTALLGDAEDMTEIAEAVRKIQRNSREFTAVRGN